MLKTAFLLSLVLLSAQAKTRKGPFPAKVWEKLRNEPLVDEDESKIVGGTDVEDLSERPYQVSKLYRYSYLKKIGNIFENTFWENCDEKNSSKCTGYLYP